MDALQQQIESLFDNPPGEYTSAHHAVFAHSGTP